MTKPTFNIEAAISDLREGKDLSGKNGILTLLIKQLTEAAKAAELEQHMEADTQHNRKKGTTPKTVKTLADRLSCTRPRIDPNLVSLSCSRSIRFI